MSIASTVRRLATAGVIGSALAAAPAAAQFRLAVVESTTPLVMNSIMSLAADLGYYQREGVDVEIIRLADGAAAIGALAAGQAEMANISISEAIAAAAQNVVGIKAVTVPDKFLPFSIVARNGINSPADLAGKTFGVLSLTSLDFRLSNLVLRALGVDPATVTFVPIGPPAARGAALIAGQIDATTMSVGVYLGLADKSNIRVLVPVDQYLTYAGELNKANVVTDAVLATRRAEVEAVVRALVKAARDFANNPNLWIEAMVVARPDYARANLEVLAAQFRGAWSVNGGMDLPTFTAASAGVYGGNPPYPVIPLSQWVDFSVADAVLAQLGHYGDPARR